MPTIRHLFPQIAADQSQKHVTHNEGLDRVDALLTGFVVSASTAIAPSSPAEGEAYIVPPVASGFTGASTGDVALYTGGQWVAIPAYVGWSLRVLDEGRGRVFAGSPGWMPGQVAGASYGAALGLSVKEAELTLTGAAVTATALIPSRSIVLGVTSWVSVEITGATGYRVGYSAGGDSDFGSSLGLTVAASNVGIIGPTPVYSDTDVTVTAEGPDFTSGAVRLAALIIEPSEAPT